jgi:phosphopantothenoylcysteine decarboxylase/phosphopantothenate--cysteine ligase
MTGRPKMKKNILVGVCAGIAAYKTCELVRLFMKKGRSVKVMMTPSACEFIKPLVFQSLSRNAVAVDMWRPPEREHTQHISLAQWADVCVIAPLSANTLSKIACGICDNLLLSVVCALPQKTKVVLAPAMNECMWKNPLIQRNVALITSLKRYFVVPPQKGDLSCGMEGEGRMSEPLAVYKSVESLL